MPACLACCLEPPTAPSLPPLPCAPFPPDDLRRWLLAQECDLFRARFNQMLADEQVWGG